MPDQYQAKITGFELLPLHTKENRYLLSIGVTIPKLDTDVTLTEEGSLEFLENKYPFILNSPAFSLARSYRKTCLVEKDEHNNFHFVAYFTISNV